MNMSKNPTIDELKTLVARCDDDAGHHVLWVESNGEVHIDVLPDDLTPVGFEQNTGPKMKLRYETFQQGNGYVGAEAVSDAKHVAELFNDLKTGWAGGGGDGWIGGTDGG
jgi:hypothetical protein